MGLWPPWQRQSLGWEVGREAVVGSVVGVGGGSGDRDRGIECNLLK
jgi:hypothetical protein